MALTYTGARNLYGRLTNNDSSTNLAIGDVLINEGINMMLGDTNWPFLEKIRTLTTVASQQFYDLPADLSQLIESTITVGTIQYLPSQATSFQEWNFLNATTGVTSNNPSNYFIHDGTIGFWPIPSSSGLTITLQYERLVRGINTADFTTGSIVSIANGATAVTGTGTSWTAGMAGKSIMITSSNAANSGDGLWYPIASIDSGTTLTLDRPYLGTSISAATTAYTIGDMMIIPERYQLGPVYYAASNYWRKEDESARADRFEAQYEKLLTQMISDVGQKTTDYVVDAGYRSFRLVNPNFNQTIVGP